MRLASYKIMKTYNTKLAGMVFAAIVALDIIWYLIMHSVSSGWLVAPWVAINLPGIPLFRFLAGFLQAGTWGMVCLLITCVLFSAAVWSLISGFVFRRKPAA
jgi:hypothetical protein